ncbi:MAG: hypothetical protein K6357_08835 [Elusimicrobiota bacterium]
MEEWEKKQLIKELKTSPEDRIRWLIKAVNFIWLCAGPEIKEIYKINFEFSFKNLNSSNKMKF